MWFIGVNNKIYDCDVFPWYHELYKLENVAKQNHQRKNSRESDCLIRTEKDLMELKKTLKQKIKRTSNMLYTSLQKKSF